MRQHWILWSNNLDHTCHQLSVAPFVVTSNRPPPPLAGALSENASYCCVLVHALYRECVMFFETNVVGHEIAT